MTQETKQEPAGEPAIHILWTRHNVLDPESKKLSIPECRKIFKKAGYNLVKDAIWGWKIEAEVKGCAICQEYYEPLPVTLESREFDKRTIQDFAHQMRER